MAGNEKRLNLIINAELDKLLTELADDGGTTKAEIVRRALGIMKVYRAQKAAGRGHMGFVSDPTKLDTTLIDVLG